MHRMNANLTTRREASRARCTLRGLLIVVWVTMFLTQALGEDSLVSLGDAGRLEYRKDERGNRIPDFSHCGFGGANRDLPEVVSKVVVQPSGQDDSKQIQAAIDYVSQLTVDEDGWRGAVLLNSG